MSDGTAEIVVERLASEFGAKCKALQKVKILVEIQGDAAGEEYVVPEDWKEAANKVKLFASEKEWGNAEIEVENLWMADMGWSQW